MNSLLGSLGRKSLPLLAVLIVGLLPAASQAQSFKINNMTKGQVVVEVAYLDNALRLHRQRPCTLKPGDSTPAFMPPAGVQIFVKVYDAANPALPPLNNPRGDRIPFPKGDESHDIVLGPPRGPKVIIQPTPP